MAEDDTVALGKNRDRLKAIPWHMSDAGEGVNDKGCW